MTKLKTILKYLLIIILAYYAGRAHEKYLFNISGVVCVKKDLAQAENYNF